MAFFIDDEDEQNQEQGGGVQTSQQSATLSGGQAQAPQAQGAQPAKPDNPGNFVGIKQYIDANQKQSQKFGDSVAGKLDNTIVKAQGDIQGADTGFKQEVDQNALSGAAQAPEEAQGIVQRAASGQGNTDQEKQRFTQIKDATYKGPNELRDSKFFQPAFASLQDAQKQSDLSKTEAGQGQLLNTYYGGPGYSGGEKRLDSYLLSGPQENREKLATAREKAAPLQGQFDNISQSAADYAKTAKTQTDQAAQAARQSVQGAGTSVQSDIAKRLQDYINGQVTQNTNLVTDIPDNDVSQNTLDFLGLQGGERLFDANLMDYFKGASPVDSTPGNFASQEDYAKYLALQELAGESGGLDYLKKENQAMAGTAPKSSFDTSGLMQYLNQKNQSYDQAYKTQRGGIVEGLPQLGGEYNTVIPGLGPDVIQNMTPMELETKVLPVYRNKSPESAFARQITDLIEESLARWKNSLGYDKRLSVDGKINDKTGPIPIKGALTKGG